MPRLGISTSDRLGWVRLVGAVCAVVGLADLVGWISNVSLLRTVLPGAVEMKANTGIGMMCCGTALLVNASPRAISLRRVAQALAALTALFALCTLAEYLFDWNLGIDEWLVRDSMDAYNLFRGRMSPITAVTLAAIGLALAALPYPRLHGVAQWAGVGGITIGTAGLLAYAWNATEIVTDHWLPPVALNTAGCFALLGGGILLLPKLSGTTLRREATQLTPVEAKILVGFAAAMALLVGGGTYTYKTSVEFTHSIEWLAQTQEIRASLASLYGSVAGAEVALRDYVRTDEPMHGTDYNRLVGDVRAQLGDLRRLTADNPPQQENFAALNALVAARLQSMAAVHRAYKDFGREAARAVIGLGRETNSTRDVGALTDSMALVAERQLLERQTTANHARYTTLFSLLGTLTLAAGLFTALFRGIHREMTARRDAETALRASDQYNRSIVDSSPDCLCVLSLDGRLKRMTAQGRKLMQVDDFATIESIDWLKVWKGTDRKAATAAVEAARGGKDGRFQGYCPTLKGVPKWWDVIIMPVLDADGRPTRLLAVARDISDVKRAETELREANRFLDSLIENLPVMVAVKDAVTLRYVRINRAAEKLLGYPREALLGRDVGELMSEAQAKVLTAHDRETLAQGKLVEIREQHIQTDRNGARILHVMKMPLADGDGKAQFLLAISVDITDRKLAEQAIHELNSALHVKAEQLTTINRELESFSYSVSHDLRAPLRAIDGFALMLEEDHAPHLDAEARRYLSVIRDNSKRMGELIDDLLSFSRLGRLPVATQEIDIESLVHEVVDEALTVPLDPVPRVDIGRLPPAHGDRALLRQVWTNLISNAIKYSSKNAKPRIEVTGERSVAENWYSVSDNGVGFNMQYADKLFGVFQRLHHADEFSGTGVGLAIVHRVVTRHGGRVWAESRVDEGAVFSFTLPEVNYNG
jgi:PAS domain S-box-containing protein